MTRPATYTNPVYPENFPDPFVLRFNGRYYAYATGPAGEGRFFPQMVSRDLVHWEPRGGALAALDLPGAEEYWAPEVAYADGRFYFYYAVGEREDPNHHLRVAVAEHPLGPWEDQGLNLTPHEIFAIDAHPFRDPRSGHWYLYYARDVLQGPYAGTGAVVDRLVNMLELAKEPHDVVRPYADWQVFELQRKVKKGLDWYTVEGPFTILTPSGRYCCLYSGGRWENPNYGVAFALAEHPLGPWKDEYNANGPQVLTTLPGKVIGPGHNSVVVGPDLVTDYLVYHAWDPDFTARYPYIDRLEWRGDLPACSGPSTTPQPAPRLPDYALWLDEAEPGDAWHSEGWGRTAAGLRAESGDALLGIQPDFVPEALEVAWRGGELLVGLGEEVLDARAGSSWRCLHLRREGDRFLPAIDGAWGTPVPLVISDAGTLSLEIRAGTGVELAFVGVTRGSGD